MLAPAVPPVSLTHLPAEQAAAILLALRPGTTYRDVAARLDVTPEVALRLMREGLRSAAAPSGTPTPPSSRHH